MSAGDIYSKLTIRESFKKTAEEPLGFLGHIVEVLEGRVLASTRLHLLLRGRKDVASLGVAERHMDMTRAPRHLKCEFMRTPVNSRSPMAWP